ncbi:MAG TPA: hypothetical protein VIJ01_13135 [Candidatus Angelobacter sp.]|jgi:hypothetical protein
MSPLDKTEDDRLLKLLRNEFSFLTHVDVGGPNLSIFSTGTELKDITPNLDIFL